MKGGGAMKGGGRDEGGGAMKGDRNIGYLEKV